MLIKLFITKLNMLFCLALCLFSTRCYSETCRYGEPYPPLNGQAKVFFSNNTVKELSLQQQKEIEKKAFEQYKLEPEIAQAVVSRDHKKQKNYLGNPHYSGFYNIFKNPSLFPWQNGGHELSNILPKEYTSGQDITITKNNSFLSQGIFHDRGSDVLVVVAPGFNNYYEHFSPFLWIFKSCDIAFMNFRGHSRPSKKLDGVHDWFCRRILGLNFIGSQTTLGEHEHQEVETLTKFLKARKKYKKVIGVGLCFGSTQMAIAQANNPDLFTELMFDSAWYSLEKIYNKFLEDPSLIKRPQQANPSKWVSLLKQPGINKLYKYLIAKLIFRRNSLPVIDILNAFKQITIPVVMFFGANDRLVDQDDFQTIWNNISSKNKIVCLTKAKHLMSFLDYKFLYKTIGQGIIDDNLFNNPNFFNK